MTIDDTVLLTDDEAVAVALHQSATWPGPLPSIDDTDADALITAARRGIRSLGVRELATIDADGTVALDDGLLALVRPLLVGDLELASFMARADLEPLTDGLTVLHHTTTDGSGEITWVTHSVRPAGIHKLVRGNRGDAVELTRGLMAETFDKGVLDPANSIDASVMLLVSGAMRAERATLVAVGHQHIDAYSVPTDGGLDREAVDTDGALTPDAALELVLA